MAAQLKQYVRVLTSTQTNVKVFLALIQPGLPCQLFDLSNS